MVGSTVMGTSKSLFSKDPATMIKGRVFHTRASCSVSNKFKKHRYFNLSVVSFIDQQYMIKVLWRSYGQLHQYFSCKFTPQGHWQWIPSPGFMQTKQKQTLHILYNDNSVVNMKVYKATINNINIAPEKGHKALY